MVKTEIKPKRRKKRKTKIQVEKIEKKDKPVDRDGRRPSLTKKRIEGLKLILSMIAGNLSEDKRLDITTKSEYGEAIRYLKDLNKYNRYRLD